mgnify:CR=1 FL=1
MYAKLKSNGQIQVAPKVLRITISNPSDERLEDEGYHKVIETDSPSYNPETQYIENHYIMSGENILQVWEVKENVVVDTMEKSEELVS